MSQQFSVFRIFPLGSRVVVKNKQIKRHLNCIFETIQHEWCFIMGLFAFVPSDDWCRKYFHLVRGATSSVFTKFRGDFHCLHLRLFTFSKFRFQFENKLQELRKCLNDVLTEFFQFWNSVNFLSSKNIAKLKCSDYLCWLSLKETYSFFSFNEQLKVIKQAHACLWQVRLYQLQSGSFLKGLFSSQLKCNSNPLEFIKLTSVDKQRT